MRLLQDILYRSGIKAVQGNTEINVSAVVFDSRKVAGGVVFVAVNGVHVDGHGFIQQAVEQGATAIVCEVLPTECDDKVVYVQVEDSAYALGVMAANFYDNPSEQLQLVGITGTNGKTTTVTLLHEMFMALGKKSGLLSTIQNKIGEEIHPSTHTTPDPVQLNAFMRMMVDAGCEYCFMEVSSHAIHQQRIAGLVFSGGVFSNITHDHLDYHKTFDEYIRAKKLFFDHLPADAFALINIDDKHGKVMVQNTQARIYTYAVKSLADYKARIIENDLTGLQLSIDGLEVWCRLIGEFNAYNLLAIYSVARCLDLDNETVLEQLSLLAPAPGRFQVMRSQTAKIAVVDYAHTPDALKNVLDTILAVKKANEEVITVVGCGGDRDKDKRPVMAGIAAAKSNRVVLTADNPRSENPEEIINEMKAGVDVVQMKKVLSITDRAEAIRTAVMLAKEGDIILIAGKGHENYQEINGVKHHFDDTEVITELFNEENK